MHWLFALIIGILGLWVAPAQGASADPFRIEALQTRVAPGASGTVRLVIVVPPEHTVYKDMVAVETWKAAGLELGAAVLPPAGTKPDPADPSATREVYESDIVIEVPFKAPAVAGTYAPVFGVHYQGCRKSLCWMPRTAEVVGDVVVKADGAQGSLPSSLGTGSAFVSTTEGAAPVDHGMASPKPPAPPAVSFDGAPGSAYVQAVDAAGKDHPVAARLVVDRQALQPGQTVRVGVYLTQKAGWHTYWRSPGDIGLPTDIQWSLPDGAQAGAYAYPVPQRFELSGIVSYGYEDQVLFFSDVSLPVDLAPGTVTLGATASWLVCEVQCIPGSAELTLPIEVVSADLPPPPASAAAPLFAHFAAQHPSDPASTPGFVVETALSASAVRPEESFKAVFKITSTGDEKVSWAQEHGVWPVFTPVSRGQWMVMGTKAVETPDGGLAITIEGETFATDPLPTTDQVGGLVQVLVDGSPVRTEVILDLPWAAAGAEVLASNSPLLSLAEGGDRPSLEGEPNGAEPPAADEAESSFASMMGLAFLGGMLLNIMPCVLPVLTLKLYGLVEQGDISTRERHGAGLAYTAGIVLSFLALAVAVVVLKGAFDLNVGWGFQFQYPAYVAGLATIVFVFGLSLFGVFEVPALGANKAAEASGKEGLGGYFMTGVFATLLATPCSAPFLGTGMGFAFTLPAWGVALFFGLAGLGLAFPFALVAFVPAFYRFLPRPGGWMIAFKQVLGFTLIATTVWLVDVLGAQVGREGVTGFLVFLTFVGFSSWVFGTYGGPTRPAKHQAISFVIAVLISVAAGWRFIVLDFGEPEAMASAETVTELDFSEEIPWQAFTEERVAELSGQPIFIDFTADWCLTCKVNEKTILETKKVRAAMEANGIVPLKADWTRRDEAITRWLQRYGKAGVPFYLVLPADPGAEAIPLPEVITPAIVIKALDKATAS